MEQVGTAWRKASYSGSSNNGQCVELGQNPDRILVRDTTDREGYTMPVPPRAWREFTRRVKDGNHPA